MPSEDIEERLSRIERIVKMLLLLEIVRTKSVRKQIKADLREESLTYLTGKTKKAVE
jgi:hypothetical protein